MRLDGHLSMCFAGVCEGVKLKNNTYYDGIIPKVIVEYADNIFLDDVTEEDWEEEWKTKVVGGEVEGKELKKLRKYWK